MLDALVMAEPLVEADSLEQSSTWQPCTMRQMVMIS
jgi:hypothetical protein